MASGGKVSSSDAAYQLLLKCAKHGRGRAVALAGLAAQRERQQAQEQMEERKRRQEKERKERERDERKAREGGGSALPSTLSNGQFKADADLRLKRPISRQLFCDDLQVDDGVWRPGPKGACRPQPQQAKRRLQMDADVDSRIDERGAKVQRSYVLQQVGQQRGQAGRSRGEEATGGQSGTREHAGAVETGPGSKQAGVGHGGAWACEHDAGKSHGGGVGGNECVAEVGEGGAARHCGGGGDAARHSQDGRHYRITPRSRIGLLNSRSDAVNMCYVNATLQALASLPPFLSHLLHLPLPASLARSSSLRLPVTTELQRLTWQLLGLPHGDSSGATVGSIGSRLRGLAGGVADARAVKRAVGRSAAISLGQEQQASTGDGSGCAVGSSFLSTVGVVRECEGCGGRESGEEEFLCLSLPIPSSYPSYPACPAPHSTTAASAVAAAPAGSTATVRSGGGSRGSDTDPSAAGTAASLTHHPLSALLQHFFQDETVQGRVCTHCHRSAPCRISRAFLQLPRILILHLNRFKTTFHPIPCIEKPTMCHEEPAASLGNPQGGSTIPPPPSCQPPASPSPPIAQHTRPLASRPPLHPSPPFPQESPLSMPGATAPPSAPTGKAPHATTDPASSRSPPSPLLRAAGAPSLNPFSLAKAAGRPVVLKEVAPKGLVCALQGGGRPIRGVSEVGVDAEGMDTGESVERQLADRRNKKLKGREEEHNEGQWGEGEARECGEEEEDWAELLEGAAGVIGEGAGDGGDDSRVSEMVDGGISRVGGGAGMEEREARRGRYECRKNVDQVEIATTLDVGPFCAPAMQETISQGEKPRGSSLFALRAVVRHTGTSVAHGHYIADVADDSLSPPGWTQLDDGAVMRNVPESDVTASQSQKEAYMLFYNPEYDPPGDTLLTPAGFDAFFRGCTQLEHLSLGCLHCDFGLPPSLFQLVHLRSLAVADLSAVTTPEVKILSALTAIAIDTAVWDFDDLEPLAHLPSLTSLSVRHEVSLLSSNVRPRPFSFARLSSLSVLERVSLYQCDELRNLPHDIAERLPCLRELSISACDTLLEQPEAVTLLTGLRALTLARCPFDELPNNFGELPRLTTLVLHKLNVYFPASCGRLKAVETLVVSECTDLHELPHPLAALTALTTLCLAGSPFVVLPNDIGGLTNLHTLFLKTYRARGTLPSSFTRLASLARLELHECKLDELPEAMGELRRLRELYVLSCPQLQKLPESVAALLSLEVLVVDDCSSLFSVPKNLLYLTRLKQLELTACGKLRRAPEFLPGSLEILSLGSGAQQVMHLPGTYSLPRLKRASLNMVIFPAALSGSLSALEHLHVVLACEEEFPFPSVHVPCLRTLTLITTGLTLITTGLIKLPQLSTSSLQELCEMKLLVPELSQVPATIAALHKLTYLEINAPKLPSLPDSIGALSRLGKLILYNCNALQHLPASLTQLACLRELCVNNATITCLPASVSRLTRLQKLDLEGCAQLEALPDDVGELTLLDCLVSGGCDLLHDSEGKIRLAGGGTSCTQLQHLSLYCVHPYEYLSASLANLAHLRTLGLTHAVPLQVPGFTRLTSLTALALDIPEDADLDLTTLARLPAFATLSLSNATRNQRGSVDELPFSLAQVPWLRALELDPCSPPFDVLFPPGLSFSHLQRLLLKGCEGLERLPDDMGERLPRLRDLNICDFGWLPALKTLTLSHVQMRGLPQSFHQLTSLEVFNLLHCGTSFRFPAAFGELTAVRCLVILKGPYSTLPNDISGLTNLHTLHLSSSFPQQLLPSSLVRLTSLTRLELVECGIVELPGDIGRLSNLRELIIQPFSDIKEIPDSLTDLVNLELLKVRACRNLSSFPTTLSSLSRLKELALAKLPQLPHLLLSLPHSLEILSLGTYQRLTAFLEIPALPRLRSLSLVSVGCMRGLVPGMVLPAMEHVELSLVGEAEDLPLPLELLPNLRSIKIASAGRLKSFPKKYVPVLQRLQRIHINQAVKLRELTESVTALHRLTSIEIHAPEFSSLPDGIGVLTLDLHGCKQLVALPRDISQLTMLHSLTITGCADALDTECLDGMRGLHVAKITVLGLGHQVKCGHFGSNEHV
ncbi:unnamed protein product [Closterium sp. Yama58-4]|nr:unnamed protein product [Closterium sp. Yama58-4]